MCQIKLNTLKKCKNKMMVVLSTEPKTLNLRRGQYDVIGEVIERSCQFMHWKLAFFFTTLWTQTLNTGRFQEFYIDYDVCHYLSTWAAAWALIIEPLLESSTGCTLSLLFIIFMHWLISHYYVETAFIFWQAELSIVSFTLALIVKVAAQTWFSTFIAGSRQSRVDVQEKPC